MQQSKVSVKYAEQNSVFGRVSYHLLLEFLLEGVGWGWCSFEAGRLLTFSAFRMGAYSRWALIRGWVLNRIDTVMHEFIPAFLILKFYIYTCPFPSVDTK